MAGLAVTYTIAKTGKLLVTVSAAIGNTVGGDGCAIRMAFGTGAAPVNGAAATGTVVGVATFAIPTTGGNNVSAALAVPITGLTLGTTYWFDLQQAAITGGTTSIQNVTHSILEY
jgi:hypothetical protein